MNDSLARAERLRLDGGFRAAAELYRSVLATAHFGLGQCLGKSYEFSEALPHLEEAFRLDPSLDGAGYYAYVLERNGRMDEAYSWYQRAGDDLWTLSHFGWFLEKWGRVPAAVDVYETVLARNPGHTWTAKRYALLLRSMGDDAGARALLRPAPVNYLEYLLLAEDDEYVTVRAALSGVVVELFDYYRDCLLPGVPDAARLAVLEKAAADATVHRDFDDLTALLTARGGDVGTWQRLLRLLL